jgi:hypothetical protein
MNASIFSNGTFPSTSCAEAKCSFRLRPSPTSVGFPFEGVFHEIQNTSRNIERLRTKTVLGLCTRIIAKMTSHLLRHLLLIDFGVNAQTIQAVSAF